MIRKATGADLAQLMEIYNNAVLFTTATFDTETKDLLDRRQWLAEHEKNPYVIMVDADQAGTVKGYASLSQYRARKAFDPTVEISVYIAEKYRGQGIGRALMNAVIYQARENPSVCTIVSLIEGSNEGSIRLHESLGFSYCGKLTRVGYKFGRWLDLLIYQMETD